MKAEKLTHTNVFKAKQPQMCTQCAASPDFLSKSKKAAQIRHPSPLATPRALQRFEVRGLEGQGPEDYVEVDRHVLFQTGYQYDRQRCRSEFPC